MYTPSACYLKRGRVHSLAINGREPNVFGMKLVGTYVRNVIGTIRNRTSDAKSANNSNVNLLMISDTPTVAAHYYRISAVYARSRRFITPGSITPIPAENYLSFLLRCVSA